jgi:flagellar basal body-associated protein FliL
MSTTMTAIVIALVGLVAVLAVAGAFYLVGRAEDRDREAARRPPEPEPAPEPSDEARRRRRPLPPRRPT